MAPSELNGANGLSNGAPHTNGIQSATTNGLPPKTPGKGSTSYSAKFHLADHFIGGNRIDAASPGKVKNFVVENDGHTVITSVGHRMRRLATGSVES